MSEQTGNAHVIPLLWHTTATLEPIKQRLESFGYAPLTLTSPEFKALNLIYPPHVGLLPITHRLKIEDIKNQVKTYAQLYPKAHTSLIGVYSGRLGFRIPELYNAGLNGIFQTPLEDEMLINKVFELSPIHGDHKNLSLDQLMRISIVEIERSKNLPFDLFLYLPMNKKVILYLEKNAELDEKIIKKFRSNDRYNLFIRRSDIATYQDYGKKIIQDFGPDSKLEQSEKNKEIASRITGLMGAFFSEEDYSEDEGQQMLANLKAFTSDIREDQTKSPDLEKQLNSFASQKLTSVSHSQNVAAYCALFGLSAGLKNPEALRMGGLLHDIGVSELGPELSAKPKYAMSTAEQTKYKSHPALGKQAIERLKLKVPLEVMDMILYHHEHTDGTGHPHGKKGSDLSPYAKVCAFADEFDKLTSIRPGFPQLSPFEAIRTIAGLDGKTPSPIFDPDFHQPIVDSFLKKETTHRLQTEAKPLEVKETKPQESAATLTGYVPISRLLKTPEFTKPAYLPEMKYSTPTLQAEMEDLALQLVEHFKKPPVSKAA